MDVTSSLHTEMLRVMNELGYTELLPIQEKSIPVILRGHNTLIVAPTGSGKTEAALFPVLSLMLRKQELKAIKGVKLIYITPLRALNRDIVYRIERIVSLAGFSIMLRHGDSTTSARKRFLIDPPDIMVTTPESLNMLLTVKNARKLFAETRWIIVDEIHELIDSERGSELSVLLERLQRLSNHRIQRIGLSATLSRRSIREAVKLLASGRRAEVVIDPSPKLYEISVHSVDDKGFWKNAASKIAELVKNADGRVLVFVNTRGTAEKLGSALSRILGEGLVLVHHGSLSRSVREDAEKEFKTGQAKVLVATSSMELGIDIGDIELVIQFLSPRSVISMTQRAGRAGHRFGETSRAYIITSNNLFELLESNVIAFRAVKGNLEDLKIHVNPLDALMHQIAAMVLEDRLIDISMVYDIISRSGPFRSIGYDKFLEVVEFMDKLGVVRIVDGSRLKMGRRTISYFYKVSMIPDERNYTVYDVITGDKIGELSERFIEAKLAKSETEQFRFVLAGRIWEALDIDYENNKIYARLIAEAEGLVPSWEGELIPVDYKVAREACSIFSLCMVDEKACLKLLKERGVREDQVTKIIETARSTKAQWDGIILGFSEPVIESFKDYIVLYTCLGSKGNFALALLLSKLLERHGHRVIFDYIPYAIVFNAPLRMSPTDLKNALLEAKKMDSVERRILVQDAVKSSIAYQIRFSQVAKRMGVIDPDSSISRELMKRIARSYEGTLVEIEALREIVYDKLDFNAVDDFLERLYDIKIAPIGSESSLLKEVFSNPYLRKDKAVDLRTVAISTLIESYKRRIKKRRVLLQCASCGYSWSRTVELLDSDDIYCPRCKARFIAPLPDTEWGHETSKTFKKYLETRRRPRGDANKRINEVYDRAQLFIEYYREGLSRYVIEALMAPGVGPSRALRVMNALLSHGEKGFYRELFKAIEEYSMNKKYWSSKKKR